MRKEDTYTLLGTLFSDTLAWVSGKRKSPKVLNLRTFLIFFRLYQAVRTGLEPATPGVTGLYSNQLNYRTFFIYASNNRCCSQLRVQKRRNFVEIILSL